MTADDRVDLALRDLALHLPPIAEGDVSLDVLERLRHEAGRPVTRSRSRLTLAVAAVCLGLLAALGLSAPVRDAAASLLELVGIDIRHADEGARPPQPSPPVHGELGTKVPVADVSAAAGFAVPIPHDPALGAPDEAYLVDGGPYQVVTLVWRDVPGIPVAPASSASVMLSAFHGAPPDAEFVQKILYEGARAHRVTVAGGLGVFVDGPQTVLYVGSDLQLRQGESRLSANSLIWQQSGLTLRIESALGERGSLALARTVR